LQSIWVHHQYHEAGGVNHCIYLQIPLAVRTAFQVDQAEPENQIILWYQPECCIDSDLVSHVLLPAVILYQVPDEIPSLITRMDKNDRCRCHGEALADILSLKEQSLTKGQGPGISTGIILTEHY
jgi:hypothetical protein